MTDFNLDEHIVSLLRDEPFFAALSRRMEKVATKGVPTAGVKFNEDRCRFEMYYNPEFMNELHEANPTFVKGVLLHEFYHIVLLHVTSRIPGDRMTKKWNVATDLAINSELSNFEKDFDSPSGYVVQSSMLPLDKALIPSVGPFAKYPPHLSAEEYMGLLPEHEDKNDSESGDSGDSQSGDSGEQGDGDGNGFDDHSDWGDSDGTDEKRKIAEERLKEAVKEAYVCLLYTSPSPRDS